MSNQRKRPILPEDAKEIEGFIKSQGGELENIIDHILAKKEISEEARIKVIASLPPMKQEITGTKTTKWIGFKEND